MPAMGAVKLTSCVKLGSNSKALFTRAPAVSCRGLHRRPGLTAGVLVKAGLPVVFTTCATRAPLNSQEPACTPRPRRNTWGGASVGTSLDIHSRMAPHMQEEEALRLQRKRYWHEGRTGYELLCESQGHLRRRTSREARRRPTLP